MTNAVDAEIKDVREEILNFDDRTSPEEYPEMVLVTLDEIEGFIRRVLKVARAGDKAPATTWNHDMAAAPRDGTLLQLLIGHDDAKEVGGCGGGFDDAEKTRTMGFNNFDNDEIDKWQFPGWDWCHDCITEQGLRHPGRLGVDAPAAGVTT